MNSNTIEELINSINESESEIQKLKMKVES